MKLINQNRFQAVISKIGKLTEDNKNDVLNDFNNNYYCIFEDDIIFIDNFKEKLEIPAYQRKDVRLNETLPSSESDYRVYPPGAVRLLHHSLSCRP